MDIVGPLVRSSGHQYVLDKGEQTIHFPEAYPLLMIIVPVVLCALLQQFLRLSLLDEILSDQGTNYTLRLM